MITLEPDRDQLEVFVDAIFRHAGDQGWISFRSFYENDSKKSFRLTPASLSGDFKFLVDVAEDDARRAANDRKAVVFCPPLAVFRSKDRAGEKDLLRGLALSVECDQHPLAARARLEQLLGPATVVVSSGGEWTDPTSGEMQPKLHLHWRLREPVQDENALAALKLARQLATELVGGDPSNKPICHPIRWPGSWHRKGEPTLCSIEAQEPDREIDLDTALAALTAASGDRKAKSNGSDQSTAGERSTDWSVLVEGIITGRSYHDPLVKLAARLIGSGLHDGSTVTLLRALMDASEGARDERWQARYDDIPRTVFTAREKYEHKAEPSTSAPWRFHTEADPEATPWLIKGLLPENGAGLVSGQWGTYKTTIALDISVSVMANLPFAGRFRVKRQGGVVYIAAEGAGGLASRLTTVARARGITGALPFAYRADCPPLTDPDALPKLAALVASASKEIADRFNLPTVAIFVDTVVTAAAYKKSGDDNDAAAAQRVMTVLSGLSQHASALVLGVDHFGKATETGTRGSSAKEGAADVVLALLADRELSGAVTNTRLAIRKLREGVSGSEIPFAARMVEVGTDPDGEPVNRVVIDWKPSEQPQAKDGEWSKSLRLLQRILLTTLADSGQDIRPFPDAPIVRACKLGLVRAEFGKQYVADGDARQKAATRRMAFNRAIRGAQDKNLIMTRELGGEETVWLAKAR